MRERLTFAEMASVDRTEDRLIETYASECGRFKVVRVESYLDNQSYWLAVKVHAKGEHPIHLPGRRWHSFRGRGAAEKACRHSLGSPAEADQDSQTSLWSEFDMSRSSKRTKKKATKTAAKASAKKPKVKHQRVGGSTIGVAEFSRPKKSRAWTKPEDVKLSALDAAAQVLAKAKAPMSAKEIVEQMIQGKLWSSSGKTPDATLYAAMIREISAKGDKSRFARPEPGKFALASAS